MTWVTGGAGYIGAHVVEAFRADGLSCVVVDDLSSGHRDFVPDDVPFVKGRVLDADLLARTMRTHHVTGVVHVAAFKYAGVSVQRPLHTYEQNVTGTVRVLQAMQDTGVDFEPEIHPRRPGDPARLVASGDLAARDFGWQMRHTVDNMVASAWKARRLART